MTPKSIILLLFISLAICPSCFKDKCEGLRTEQLYKFGQYIINIDTPADTLSIGDSIHFRMLMPCCLYDSISRSEIEADHIDMGFYVTRDTDEPKDTSLIYIFDQYFDIVLNKGEMMDPYHFRLEKDNGAFALEFYYVCRKKLKYYIPIRFEHIVINNLDTKCIQGNTSTWNARLTIDSPYNGYEDLDHYPFYFGFIVH